MKYEAVFFHPAGDFVTDFKADTKQEIWERISDMGSRWIFYPIPVIISTNGKNITDCIIVDVPDGLEYMERHKVKTLQKMLIKEWDTRPQEICDMLNDGTPLCVIY